MLVNLINLYLGYVGPGLAIGAFAIILAIFGSLVIFIVGLLFYPLKYIASTLRLKHRFYTTLKRFRKHHGKRKP